MPDPSMPGYRADTLVGPPPGWYVDPQGLQVLRWWDGARWGPQTQPLPGVIRAAQTPGPPIQLAGEGRYGPVPDQDAGPGQPDQHWQQLTGAHSPESPPEPRSGTGHSARLAVRSKPDRVRNTILIVIGGLVALSVIAGIAGAHGKGEPAASASTAAATGRASAFPRASSTTATMRDRMVAWIAGPGGTALYGVTSALGAVHSAGQSENGSAMGSACSQLVSAVMTAQTAPAIPDPAAEKWWVRALAQYEQAAAFCQAGVSSMNTATIEQASAAMSVGNTDIAHTTAAVDALSS